MNRGIVARPFCVRRMRFRHGPQLIKRKGKTMLKIVHNKLLGGWFVVRGPHHTPISGKFAIKAEAKASLKRKG